MMKHIIFALALALLPTTAQADNATLDCPSSVKEGGQVAQAVNCPSPDLPIGYPYCEYRDGNGPRWSDTARVGDRRQENLNVTITASTGGEYFIWNASLDIVLATNSGGVPASHRLNVAEGETASLDLRVWGRANYAKSGNGEGIVYVGPPGSFDVNDAIASCTITVEDDDNNYYIGQRRQHPYGGTWISTPHCFTRGCAWD